MVKELYRYRKVCYDENLVNGDGSNNVEITCNAFLVLRETKEYYIIQLWNKKEKRVKKNGYSCFANKNQKEALKDFIKRSQKSISLNKHYIRFTELAIDKAQKQLNNF